MGRLPTAAALPPGRVPRACQNPPSALYRASAKSDRKGVEWEERVAHRGFRSAWKTTELPTSLVDAKSVVTSPPFFFMSLAIFFASPPV